MTKHHTGLVKKQKNWKNLIQEKTSEEERKDKQRWSLPDIKFWGILGKGNRTKLIFCHVYILASWHNESAPHRTGKEAKG